MPLIIRDFFFYELNKFGIRSRLIFANLFDQSELYWNGEEEDGDDEEPEEEREKINGYSVEEKHDKPLSGPMQKSADPILPFIGLRLLRRAFRRRRRRRRRRFG